MEEYGVIYMYTSPSNKKYVGQTIYPDKRHLQHLKNAFNPNTPDYNNAIHRAFRKYGIENMKYEILEENIPREQLNEREMYWIEKMDSFNNGYNSTQGGDGNLGRKWTKEQREFMSKIVSTKNIGRIVSEETRRKIGDANRGKSHPRSEETRRKISEHNARAVRNKVTFETQGVYKGKEFYPGLVFDSVKECAEYFGVHITTMSTIKAGKFNKKSNMKIIEVA